MATCGAGAASRAYAADRRAHFHGRGGSKGQARIAAFLGGLQRLGWTEGRNAQIDFRWPKGGAEARKYAAELVALAPDLILATGVYAGSLLQQETQTIDRTPVSVHDPGEIERGVAEFARSPNGGLIVTAGGPVIVHRAIIISLPEKYQLPAVYFNRMYPVASGLMSYGPDTVDQYRRATVYVDRILKGESPPTCRCKRRPSTSW